MTFPPILDACIIGIRWKQLAGPHQAVFGDNRVRADSRAVHDGRADADQDPVPDLAGIQEVINRYNKSFRSQHGFIASRIPAALASSGLGSAAIDVIIRDLSKGKEDKPKGKGSGDKNLLVT